MPAMRASTTRPSRSRQEIEAVQIVGLGQNPAVGGDDHAQGGFTAVAQNAHRALAGHRHDVAKRRREQRVAALIFEPQFLELAQASFRTGERKHGQEHKKIDQRRAREARSAAGRDRCGQEK